MHASPASGPWLAALYALAFLLGGCAPMPSPRAFPGELPSYREGTRFAMVSDMQRTSLLEFWRESNDPERARIASALAAARPAFLVLGGDLVFDGASERQWQDFDAIFEPVHRAAIPVFAAFGNHEYWNGRAVEAHFFCRFPHLDGRHWYVIPHGPLRIIVLDSNPSALSSAEWHEQRAWYEKELVQFDGSADVRGVLVLLHHPPFTNSTVTSDEEHVQRDLVPAFIQARKTLGMISGHVHSYERFRRSGKTFVVSGGGGGPRAMLASGTARRHPDDLFNGPALRHFHFLLFTMTAAGLDIDVMALPKGGSVWSIMDRFALAWPIP